MWMQMAEWAERGGALPNMPEWVGGLWWESQHQSKVPIPARPGQGLRPGTNGDREVRKASDLCRPRRKYAGARGAGIKAAGGPGGNLRIHWREWELD